MDLYVTGAKFDENYFTFQVMHTYFSASAKCSWIIENEQPGPLVIFTFIYFFPNVPFSFLNSLNFKLNVVG